MTQLIGWASSLILVLTIAAPAPVQAAMDTFSQLLDQLEALL